MNNLTCLKEKSSNAWNSLPDILKGLETGDKGATNRLRGSP